MPSFDPIANAMQRDSDVHHLARHNRFRVGVVVAMCQVGKAPRDQRLPTVRGLIYQLDSHKALPLVRADFEVHTWLPQNVERGLQYVSVKLQCAARIDTCVCGQIPRDRKRAHIAASGPKGLWRTDRQVCSGLRGPTKCPAIQPKHLGVHIGRRPSGLLHPNAIPLLARTIGWGAVLQVKT